MASEATHEWCLQVCRTFGVNPNKAMSFSIVIAEDGTFTAVFVLSDGSLQEFEEVSDG